MSETPVCEVCGHDKSDHDDRAHYFCATATLSRQVATLLAALSAAEKREARLREALAKYWTGCRKCASWLGTDGPVTPAGSWFRGCDACRELREAYRATKAALELASAASAAPAAPEAISESRPLDPPETA